MRLLVLDTETTGLSFSHSKIIEVAAALHCTTSHTILASLQFLVPHAGVNEAEHINGITHLMLTQEPVPGSYDMLRALWSSSDCVVAHNARFDRHFLTRHFPSLPEKPWVCTVSDISFPKTRKSRVLSHIAADHDIPVFKKHRALDDVLLLSQLLALVPDLDNQIKARVPLVTKVE